MNHHPSLHRWGYEKIASIILLYAIQCITHTNAFQTNHHISIRSFHKANSHINQKTKINLQTQSNNEKLNIAVVGGGPSGLLLTHALLSSPLQTKITIFESRSDPRTKTLQNKAYALGLGIRGRTAIKSVSEHLWTSIKRYGYECEKFDLHIGKFRLRLRDGKEQRIVTQRGEEDVALEPSVLIYQSDLCSAMIDELDTFRNDDKVLQLHFDTIVQGVNINNQTIQITKNSQSSNVGPFDLIVGCDGVNSQVRKSIENTPNFQSSIDPLPGKFKVVRLSFMPPLLDPTSIHAIPSSDGSSAFVEPTKNGEACILFATRKSNDSLFSENESYDEIRNSILDRFPLLQGIDVQSAVEQIMSQQSSSTYAIKCNMYHYKSCVLCGDAAHATGGVSGQGVNSALQDAVKLVQSLEQNKNIPSALLSYSQSQVPEGHALFDLSFGPQGLSSSSSSSNKPTKIQMAMYAFKNILDTVFGGRFGIGQPTLQTVMTTSVVPFSEIRRGRDSFYVEEFHSVDEWNDSLTLLHEKQLLE